MIAASGGVILLIWVLMHPGTQLPPAVIAGFLITHGLLHLVPRSFMEGHTSNLVWDLYRWYVNDRDCRTKYGLGGHLRRQRAIRGSLWK